MVLVVLGCLDFFSLCTGNGRMNGGVFLDMSHISAFRRAKQPLTVSIYIINSKYRDSASLMEGPRWRVKT